MTLEPTHRPTSPPPPPTGPPRTDRRSPSSLRRAATVIAAGLVFGVVLFALTAYGAVDEEHTIRPAAAVTRIEIDIDAGTITTRPGEELTVAVGRRSGWLAPTPSTRSDIVDGVLEVTGTCTNLGLGRCDTPVSVDIPPGVPITATTGAGNIDVTGATAGADLHAGAGGIRVDDVAGPLRLRTAAGSIDATLTSGAVEATTSAGSIAVTVTEDATDISATTRAGDVELVVPDAVYTVGADTRLGRLRVDVRTADDASRHIDARSDVGEVTVRTTS